MVVVLLAFLHVPNVSSSYLIWLGLATLEFFQRFCYQDPYLLIILRLPYLQILGSHHHRCRLALNQLTAPFLAELQVTVEKMNIQRKVISCCRLGVQPRTLMFPNPRYRAVPRNTRIVIRRCQRSTHH